MLVSSYHVAVSFITSKFSEHNTENEEFEKSRVLQKCPLTHITLIMITMIIMIMIIIIAIIVIIKIVILIKSKNNDNDDENNMQIKDDNNNKKIIKKAKKKKKKQKANTITTNKTLITDKTLTGEERKTKYLLHPNYEKTALSNMQCKHHVH